MILAVMAALVIPRVASFSAGDLQRTSRRLASGIQHLTQESASTKEIYRLYFNLDSNEYWTATLRKNGDVVDVQPNQIMPRRTLPVGVVFEDLMTIQHGKVTQGEVFSEFHPVGVEAMTIHLQQDSQQGFPQHYTLLVNPLTGRVSIKDNYVELHE